MDSIAITRDFSMKMVKPVRFIIWSISLTLLVIGWIIYSYTQIDLNLTLSANTTYQALQKILIDVGYYQRYLSGVIFLSLLILTFVWYIFLLRFVEQKRLTQKQIWICVIITAFLIFAYPAFSHDIFNYMFDARIVTKYHLDPHFFKALDFANDPWVRFMHWTHRYFPYGQGWLLISLVPSLLGMGKFILTLLLFKGMFLGFHLLNSFLITKIAQKTFPQRTNFALAFYGLNPLILIEGLISPHNEVMMLSLVLMSILFLVKSESTRAIVSLIASISIKFVSVILLPLIFWKKKVEQSFFIWGVYLWLGILIPIVLQREFYSWYIIPVIGVAALTNDVTRTLVIGISLGTLARYAPFIFWGNYSNQTSFYQNIFFGTAMFLSVVLYWGICRKKSSLLS